MTAYCENCGCERTEPGECGFDCAGPPTLSFDGLVDKLQALQGIDRDEAEKLAEDILSEDAA